MDASNWEMSIQSKVVPFARNSSGIGAAVAVYLAKEEAKTAVVGWNETKILNSSVKCETASSKKDIPDINDDEDIKRIILPKHTKRN